MEAVNKYDKDIVIGEWIHTYQRTVIRTAFYYVRDMRIAEDIAQEVFLRAYKHMEKYRADASVKTWLHRMTINACKDYLKSWSFRTLIFSNFVRPHGSVFSAEDEALGKLERNDLLDKIMRLSVIYREVILLYFFEEMTMKEISILLDVKETTIRTRLDRGVARLRRQLSEEEGQELYGQIH